MRAHPGVGMRRTAQGGRNTAGRTRIRHYLVEIPDIEPSEVDAVLAAVGVRPHELARRLGPRARARLAAELERHT